MHLAFVPLQAGHAFAAAERPADHKEETMRAILIVIVLLLLLGALPTWPYSAG